MKRVCLVCALLLIAALPSMAQDPSDFEKGFQPYQSYGLTDFDTINLLNGNLLLHIPIISYPQRGNMPPFAEKMFQSGLFWL